MNEVDVYSTYPISPYSALGLIPPATHPALPGHMEGVRRVVMNLDPLGAEV